MPVAAALYLALASVNRNAMLAGARLLVLLVILDLAITWPNYAALISLSAEYAATTGEAHRATLIAAASYPKAILDSSLLGAYINLVPGLGVLVIGLVLLCSKSPESARLRVILRVTRRRSLLGTPAMGGPSATQSK
jgi:hypothetical protein